MPNAFWLKRLYHALASYRYHVLSRLPHPDIKEGDQFEALVDFEAIGMTHWNVPFTGGFDCIIPKGTILLASHDSIKRSMSFVSTPKNYYEMEKKLVPEQDRIAQKYSGYSVVLRYRLIGKRLRKL